MTGAEQIIYFHGLPGSDQEIALFGTEVAACAKGFHVVDRTSARIGSSSADYFKQIAADIKREFPGTPLRLIGFSLGASAALRTAPYLDEQVRHIDLVSAAAPLDLGNYLERMAGAAIFKIARTSPFMFGMLASAQSAMATLLPRQIQSMLFASAQGADVSLAENPEFMAGMDQVLQQCLGKGLPGYRREILLYTENWLPELDHVTAPVSLLHGKADNWSPVAMAEDLAQRLPTCRNLQILDGQSHYSALRQFLLDRSFD